MNPRLLALGRGADGAEAYPIVPGPKSSPADLYLGTERGVMFSTNDGSSWLPLKLNLPTVAVHDLAVKQDDLVVGTHTHVPTADARLLPGGTAHIADVGMTECEGRREVRDGL